MLQYVHRPHMHRLLYRQVEPGERFGRRSLLSKLRATCGQLDLELDPYVLKLKVDSEPQSKRKLSEILVNGKTRCRNEMMSFYRKAEHVHEELGQWAADYFISESTKRFQQVLQLQSDSFLDLENEEKVYILNILLRVIQDYKPADNPSEPSLISPKVEKLIEFLLGQEQVEISGLVFVRQRATVGVLSELLATHPSTKHRFRCAPYVGWSNSANRKHSISELLDLRDQRETLADFRQRRKNLIIATAVLEEGIDISACNLVIDFDMPPNLKSFVQRRGRARQQKSTFAFMVAENSSSNSISTWQHLEEMMIQTYQDDTRQIQQVSTAEDIEEDVPHKFHVQSTGALLTADTAVAHLHHFCAVLPPQPYVDLRPIFTFREGEHGLVGCATMLPSCVNALLRYSRGETVWRTERAARKDAAFRAYIKLYKAGLISDNLLPFKHEPAVFLEEVERLSAKCLVGEQLNPWMNVAAAWSTSGLTSYVVTVADQTTTGRNNCSMLLTLPVEIPTLQPFELFRDSRTSLFTTVTASDREEVPGPSEIDLMRKATNLIFRSIRTPSSAKEENDYVMLLTPCSDDDALESWLTAKTGTLLAREVHDTGQDPSVLGFVRSRFYSNAPLDFQEWCMASVDGERETLHIKCISITKRRNFLQRNIRDKKHLGEVDDGVEHGTEEPVPAKKHLFPADDCTFDLLPVQQAQFGLFLPALLQHVEVHIVASTLRQILLGEVPFKNLDQIISAISAPSAQRNTDYQRHEYLGDSVLKFLTSCQLFIKRPNWHEGYLTKRRTSMISNDRLAKAAIDCNLGPFIMTKNFTAKKWTCPLISELLQQVPGKRELSTKVLADVVEALIGAAFVDASYAGSQACIHVFLPEMQQDLLSFQPVTDTYIRNTSPINKNFIQRAESLIGHTFTHKALLAEALTHPSCNGLTTTTESYQRLEYLGDAVLDMIIVNRLFNATTTTTTTPSSPPSMLSQGRMTLIKAALANADFLAYLCMSTEQEDNNNREEKLELWKFMRFQSPYDIPTAQKTCLARYRLLSPEIDQALNDGKTFPWSSLARLGADKFFSDLVESVIGAVFVDCNGGGGGESSSGNGSGSSSGGGGDIDLQACEQVLQKLGLLRYLQRILEDGIDVEHPKTKLGRVAGTETVEYFCSKVMEGLKEEEEEDGDGRGRVVIWTCAVKVGGKEVLGTTAAAAAAAVGGCLNKEEAIVRAAERAVEILMGR